MELLIILLVCLLLFGGVGYAGRSTWSASPGYGIGGVIVAIIVIVVILKLLGLF